jgi:hypothetical protein
VRKLAGMDGKAARARPEAPLELPGELLALRRQLAVGEHGDGDGEALRGVPCSLDEVSGWLKPSSSSTSLPAPWRRLEPLTRGRRSGPRPPVERHERGGVAVAARLERDGQPAIGQRAERERPCRPARAAAPAGARSACRASGRARCRARPRRARPRPEAAGRVPLGFAQQLHLAQGAEVTLHGVAPAVENVRAPANRPALLVQPPDTRSPPRHFGGL